MWLLAASSSSQGSAFQPVECLIYILGLVAAGLLPLRERRADQGVSLIMALLWGLLAFRPEAEPFWITLAVLESGLFLVIGTLLGRLRFTARNGPWAMIGTCLITYSLFIFPVLSHFFPSFRGSGFGEAAFGGPFPLVLFTCGILFFAAEWTTNLVLVLPLLWALLGGPSGSWVEVVELQVGLLAGTFFLLMPPELRSGNDRRSPGTTYRYAYKNRGAFGYGLWTVVLVSMLLVFVTWREAAPWTEILPLLTTNFVLLSLLGIALWLAFPAWQSLWFRYAAWWLARNAGRIWVWLQGAWRWGVFLLAAVVILILSSNNSNSGSASNPRGNPQVVKSDSTGKGNTGEKSNKNAAPAPQVSTAKNAASKQGGNTAAADLAPKTSGIQNWSEKAKAWAGKIREISAGPLIATVLLWLSYQAYRARQRLVIGAFADYTGTDKSDKWLPNIGARLQNELVRIADLFKVIDEICPSPTKRSIEVTPNVQDVGEVLKDASAITIGSLQIGSKLLAGFIGSLVSGRRLTGALHKRGKDYVLTAELSGGSDTRSWRADFAKYTAEEQRQLEDDAAVDQLVEQLAYRIATDLVPIGSPRWFAVRRYIDGLRAQRETQRRQADKNAMLREAERSFIEALNDDQRFTQCHYNLGVVYRQLSEWGSAESAFRRALKGDPDHFEACYALALTAVDSCKPDEAVWFCKAAIEINSADPRPWDLQAYARRDDEETRLGPQSLLPHGHPAWTEILESSEIAGALAWRALCLRLLQEPSTAVQTPEQANAYLCIRNLAVYLTRAGDGKRSEQVFRQAAWIAPHDPNPRLYEGRTLFWNQEKEGASAALEGVFDDGLESIEDRGLLWGISAQIHAHATGEESSRNTRLAIRRFLDLAATSTDQDLEKLLKVSLEEQPKS